jgi:hypothetical protein
MNQRGQQDISMRVLNRRQESGKTLTSRESECVVRMALILDMADTVFGSYGKALIWLRRANEQLPGKKPLKLRGLRYDGYAIGVVGVFDAQRLARCRRYRQLNGKPGSRAALLPLETQSLAVYEDETLLFGITTLYRATAIA